MIRSQLLLLVCLFSSALAQETKPAQTVAELRERIESIVTQPRFTGAIWGIQVASQDTGRILFERDAHKLLSPASNCKLYTVALALDRLGADYRIKTSLYAAARPDRHGTLKGDLILYGRGDPTINARLHGGSIMAALEPLAAALINAGVKRITGDLVADESYFRGSEFGSGWAWDDMQYYYGAEVSALTINDNTLQATVRPGERVGVPCALSLTPATSYVSFLNQASTVHADERRTISFSRAINENVVRVSGKMPLGTNVFTDEITMHRPALMFGDFFRESLRRHGVKLKGKVRGANWLDRQGGPINLASLVELGSAESLPLGDIAREVQKPSQNLYTDLLLAHVGEKSRSATDRPEATSEEMGIRELGKFVAEAGVPENEVVFEEGSGLSRDNLATANATVTLLRYMSRHHCAGAYMDALPVAGVDGTLRNRMKNTRAAGNMRAKTGSLRWSASLSGYVTSASGERLVFSLMLNRFQNPTVSARTELDAVALLLAEFEGKCDDK